MANTSTDELIRGFRVVLECAGQRDIVIVRLDGIETETDAICKAIDAGHLAYPNGSVSLIECTGPDRYFASGMNGTQDGAAVWQN